MRTVSSRALIAAILLSVPLVLGAQKPQKPPKPGGSTPNPAIAFEARNNSGYFDLMVMDADGKNLTRLMRGGDNSTPSWSPDGEWIAFARHSVSSPGIYLIRRDGTGLCHVAATHGDGLHTPTWSPQVGPSGLYKIVYADRPIGESLTDLFAVDARCGDNIEQNLTMTPALGEGAPAWAPGELLAVAVGGSGYENDIQVFEVVTDADGSVSLSSGMSLSIGGPLEAANKWGPAWAPDRTGVVVSVSLEVAPGSEQRTHDLWMLSTDGSGYAVRLTDSPDVIESPATWSPEAAYLAFDANQTAIIKAAVGAGPWSLGTQTVLAVPPKGYRAVARPSWRPVQ